MITLVLNPASGIAGDMLVAALLDLGAGTDEFWRRLRSLPLGDDEWQATATRVVRGGVQATYFAVTAGAAPARTSRAAAKRVTKATKRPSHSHAHAHPHTHEAEHKHDHEHEAEHDHPHAHSAAPTARAHTHAGPHRHLPEILGLLARADLPAAVRERASATFRLLAQAEGAIHGLAPEAVHFHEVGAVDAIIDITAACLAAHTLGVAQAWHLPPSLGGGTVRCEHGIMPVPAPAVARLLIGVPTRLGPAVGELTTPTGAALLRALASPLAAPLAGTIRGLGYGAGTRELADRPNVLQALLYDTAATGPAAEAQSVAVLECNLDDLPGARLSHILPKLLAAGALDVAVLPCLMKKGRQGMVVQVLCAPDQRPALTELLLRETSTFGVRWHLAERRTLAREVRTIATTLGPVEVKLGYLAPGGELLRLAPEYESCRALAEQTGKSLEYIYELALAAAHRACRE